MLLGIMSDSHDNIPMIKLVVVEMKRRKIDVLLHGGDFIAPFSIPYLKESGASKIIGIYGNNDGEIKGLQQAFEAIGGTLTKPPYRLEIGGFNVLMMHESYYLADAKEDPALQLVIYGHTHKLFIERKSGKIILNPGEVCGYLTGKRTFVLLDTMVMEPEVIDL